MTKIIYCEGCRIKVAEIVTSSGNKIKTGAVMLCDPCNRLRISLELKDKTKKRDYGNFFDDLINGKKGAY